MIGQGLSHRGFSLVLVLVMLCASFSGPLSASAIPAGDNAPYGARNGVLNAGDLVVLQRMILGEITPTATDLLVADVAPLGSPDGVLNAADYLLLMRALQGLVTLPAVQIGPEPPTDLSATAVSDSQIDLTWVASVHNAGGTVAGYNIYRDGGGTPIATVTETSYSDMGLTAETAYSYTVSAFDTAVPPNESAQSSAVMATTGAADEVAPDTPTGLSATPVSDTRIDLEWTASSDNGGGTVAGYNIYRVGVPTPVATVTGTSWSDTGLTANTFYSYGVTAFDDAVPANESAPASISASTFSQPVNVNISIIQQGAAWKYLDNGSDQGTAWRSPGFDDSGWASGAAQLGYGDGDEATVVSFGPDANNKYITTWFRRSFDIEDATRVLGLTVNLLRDDGAVVYLNGTEVVRSNMPGGTISYTTLAATAIGNPEEQTWYSFSVDPALLVTGSNVIAVEVHQGSVDSSDLSFDLGLDAVTESDGGGFTPITENFNSGLTHPWVVVDEAG
ncbi:MAG: fibronectin type III domain-containing protein, partial [Thiogranum sp.]|nr:fibronectin type III domain-containing protein [Thiogranum sp.]